MRFTLRSTEVGEGAGDFQDPVVGAGGEVHLVHGWFEVALAFRVERAEFAHGFRAHGGVGGDAFAGGEVVFQTHLTENWKVGKFAV